MRNVVDWPYTDTGWLVADSVRSPRSSRPTRFSGGIGSSSRGNGRTPLDRAGRGVLAEIQRLVVRMGGENRTWGYTRIQGALKSVGHRVGRSTIARILKAHGPAARAGATDVLADVSAGPLGC